jgi:hypothetical protein
MSTQIDTKINAFLAKYPALKIVLSILTALLGAAKAKGYFAKKFGLALTIAAITGDAFAQDTVRRTELFKYNLNATTATYFVLGPDPGTAGTALIEASASTTVTAVSGTPFANVSVGDMLIIKNSDGVVYKKSVIAKATGASITVSLPAITLTNASFTWRKLAGGTAATNGGFPMSGFQTFTVQVVVDQISLGSGDINVWLECRASPDATWAPAYPVAVPPAAQTPFSVTAVGSYLLQSQGAVESCRVGLNIDGTDDGADTGSNAEYVSIFTIGVKR